MPSSPPPSLPNASEGRLELLLDALGEVAGAALVLDAELRVVGASPAAVALLGEAPPPGVSAVALLCGQSQERPVAEALARGEAVRATVLRPTPEGPRAFEIRASPIRAGDPEAPREAPEEKEEAAGSEAEGASPKGWLLALHAEEGEGADSLARRWGIVTRDPSMMRLLTQVKKVGPSDASVLVRGETGSGKELIARAIHAASDRASGPFRAINCAALPPALLESELFGHARGAFTGAVRDNPGHFRLADKGTLFLDEVGELPLAVQAKLLRVLQEKTVIPVGGMDAVAVDVRVVAATHRSLRRAVEEGEFRADLMYRLRVIPLFLPPLRDRPADIEVLAEHFVAALGGRSSVRTIERITGEARRAMRAYPWPGNVRELQNALEYALVMGEGPLLAAADLPPEIRGQEPGAPRVNAGAFEEEGEGEEELPEEARRILTAIERAGGHLGRASKALGISRVTLWRRLRKYGIDHD